MVFHGHISDFRVRQFKTRTDNSHVTYAEFSFVTVRVNERQLFRKSRSSPDVHVDTVNIHSFFKNGVGWGGLASTLESQKPFIIEIQVYIKVCCVKLSRKIFKVKALMLEFYVEDLPE